MSTESPYRTPESNVAGGGNDSDDALESAFIGPKNTDYYLEKFRRIESGSGGVSWHWPAFFITWIWLGYRKMWLWFFVYWLVLPIAVATLGGVLAAISPDLAVIANFAYLIAIFVIPPIFANKLYYHFVKAKIAKIQGLTSDAHAQQMQAARTGGTSNIAIFIIILVFLIGVLAAIAIPAYQDYTIRAQVSEGLHLSDGPKAAVSEFYLDEGRPPVDNAEAGLTAPASISGNYVESVAVDNGGIEVTYGNQAHTILSGKTLFFVPDEDRGSISWSCGSIDIDTRHLPTLCR